MSGTSELYICIFDFEHLSIWRTKTLSSAFSEVFIYSRIDITIDISISTRPMTTKLGKKVHLDDLTLLRLIKYVLVALSRSDHVKN